jgi:hypothetical protein
MKIIITEEQFSRFNRSSPALQNGINKYLNQYIEGGTRKIGKKSRNYGNLSEDWCIDGKNTISVYYNFDVDGNFKDGYLILDRELVKTISKLFSVKPTYVFHVIEEWYQDVMIPKFEQMVGESGLYVDKIDTSESVDDCVPEPEKPEGITDDEMIDFIVKNTLYSKPEVLQKIESGERDLEDFYLDVVDVINRKKITGF